MESNTRYLPPEIEAAVEQNNGGPISVAGRHGHYVVMNADIYGGVLEPTPDELVDSVAAIKRSLAQSAAGRVRDVSEFFDELDAQYGA